MAATLAVASPAPETDGAVPRGEPPPAPRTDPSRGDVAVVLPDTDGPRPCRRETEAEPAVVPRRQPTPRPRDGLPAGLIAYTLDTGTGTDVFVRRLDAPDERRVTTSPYADVDPDLSPDGTLVAYQGYPEPQGDTPTSSSSASTARAGATSRAPRTSTTGRRRSRPTASGSSSPPAAAAASLTLWTMAADGSDVRRLTRRRCGDADWSPDGSQLVCVGDPVGFGGKDLWLVSAETGEMTPLTDDGGAGDATDVVAGRPASSRSRST